MRHIRLPNQNFKNLSTFKKQVGNILKKINKFDEADKNEALIYLKKCIDSEGNSSNDKNKDVVQPEKKQDISKITKQGVSVSLKKITSLQNNSVKRLGSNRTLKRHKVINKDVNVKNTTLKCKICSSTKRSILNFLEHLNSHMGTPISCGKCRQSFNGRISFDFHLSNMCGKNFASKKKFKCSECSREFKYRRHFYSHVEGHKRNNCTYCDRVYTNRKQLVKHLLEAHSIKLEGTKIKCHFCDKKYARKRSLYYHTQQHVPTKFVCTECGSIIETLVEFKEHTEAHYKSKKWECPKCNDRFSRKQHYLIHLKRHERYKCITCNESFASKARIIRHKQKGHLVDGLQPRLQCTFCPKVFHRSVALQLHMKKHNVGDKTIFCRYCDKSFLNLHQYYKHCLTTSHEKNCPEVSKLLCETCGKQFNKKHLLDDHVYRIHMQREVVSCQHCNYKTKNKTNMKRHSDLHLPSEEFMCEKCGKEFSSISNLREHVSYSHLQVKQYKCEQCDKSFKRKSELSRHKKIHSDERPFVCETCGVSYKRQTHLTRHEKNAHKITKSLKAQQLQKNNNGILIPLPENKRNDTTVNMKKDFINLNQSVEYYTVTVPDMTPLSAPKPIDQNIFTQQPFWNDKIEIPNQIYNTDNTFQISQLAPTNELQTLNIVDQLVHSFLPEKQSNYYQDYNNQLAYANIPVNNYQNNGENLVPGNILQNPNEENILDRAS